MSWGLQVAKCNLGGREGGEKIPSGCCKGRGWQGHGRDTAGTQQGHGRDTAGPSAGHRKAGEGAGIAERTKYGNLDKTELK